ncbi:hypothetical protein HYR54_12510 [Candidatus Acetothermia bacterium]|nr:hypothetical protein [Candidatus Acetothermia bacterium]MBI3460565.1 hypothetical protein [Candidatus Acetothermia bacterium]MBI3661309.1 hypothetical protein [Candidatus Acetothermia bacterium]
MYLPMFLESIRRIQEGIKTTTLRPLKNNYTVGAILTLEGTNIRIQITDRQQITVPDGLTPTIAHGEGYGSVQEMVDFLRKRRWGRPIPNKPMIHWLYTFALVAAAPPHYEAP